MEFIKNNNVVNVFLSTITTGSSLYSDLINLSLVSTINDTTSSSLYIERTDINIEKIISSETYNTIYEKQLFKNKIKHNEYVMDKDLILFKDHDISVYEKIDEFLYKISNNGKKTIEFWVSSPIDWIHFIKTAFIFKDDLPIIPSHINPYPNDTDTLFRFNLGNNLDDVFPGNDSDQYSSLTKALHMSVLVNTIFLK